MGLGIGIGGSTKSGGGGGEVRLETNHSATLTTNGTHVVTPNEGYDGMRKATINVDVEAADPTDKALVANATQYGLSHNLYKVMEQVKADPRTSGYAAIMLCQYYKGYNSLSLEGGADAFLTSDGDFYVGNAVHYWHDSNDEMFDRWVAMLFSSESGSYTCSNANICPRAALIDGTMGDINITATYMRFAWIDATDGSSFGQYYSANSSYVTLWGRQLTLRGMRAISRGTAAAIINLYGAYSVNIGVERISSPSFFGNDVNLLNFSNLKTMTSYGCFAYHQSGFTGLQEVKATELITANRLFGVGSTNYVCATNVRRIICPNMVSLNYICGHDSQPSASAKGYASLIHFEIGQGFYSNLKLNMCTFSNCLLTDTNDLVEDLQAHPTWSNLDQWLWNFEHLIVDKLADLSGQTAKTITLAAAPYAAITESIRQKMSAKNWNLASA